MKKIALLIMAVILAGFVGCSGQAAAPKDTGEKVYTEAEMTARIMGTWSNVQYMDNLKTTKSPYKSICDVPWLDIRTENKETMLDEYLNFHEGGTGGTITAITPSTDKDRYAIKLKEYFEGSALGLKRTVIIDQKDSQKDSIVYTDKNNKEKYRFAKIGKTPELYANEVVLAGKYKDAKGNEYTFSKDEKAVWPTETFNYRIQLDFVGEPTFIRDDGSYYNADYFMKTDQNGVNASNFVYYYEIQGNQLSVFKAYEKEGTPLYEIKKSPDLVLTKE
jgi:hypothetical protein